MNRVFTSAWFLLLPTIAEAQVDAPCPDELFRGPVAISPAVGAGMVTVDAYLKVDYQPATYFQDPEVGVVDPSLNITVRRNDSGDLVEGTVHVLGGQYLIFQPSTGWESMTTYQGTAFGLDGDLDFQFSTGTSEDLGRPLLASIDNVRSQRVEPTCLAPEGGYRLDVSFEPAVDDGPLGSVEYLLFLTRGIDVEEPRLVGRTRNFSTTDLVTMSFVLSEDEAAAPVCVAMQAIDGVGALDDDGVGACFDPVQGNFFEPLCSVGAWGTTHGWLPMLLILVLLGRRR